MYGVFIRDEGLPASVTGLGMAAGVGAEVLALLSFPRLERRVADRVLFALVFAATALRWWLLSRAHGAGAVIGLQLFHGFTFGLFWAVSMKALSELVPPALRATGQALYAAVVFGGGNAVGYQLSGLGYDRLGGVRPLFAAAAALEAALLVATLCFTNRRAHAPKERSP
jgi:PPP family 3-phenylpropionic acid transporter